MQRVEEPLHNTASMLSREHWWLSRPHDHYFIAVFSIGSFILHRVVARFSRLVVHTHLSSCTPLVLVYYMLFCAFYSSILLQQVLHFIFKHRLTRHVRRENYGLILRTLLSLKQWVKSMLFFPSTFFFFCECEDVGPVSCFMPLYIHIHIYIIYIYNMLLLLP